MVEFLIETDKGGLNFGVEGDNLRLVLEEAVRKTEEVLRNHDLCFKEGKQLQFQHLVEAFRSNYPEVVDLDLSGRLKQCSPGEEEVEITLVSPDGERLVRTFGKEQNVGALKADIHTEYNLEPEESVFITDNKEEAVDSSVKIKDLVTDTLYWAAEEDA